MKVLIVNTFSTQSTFPSFNTAYIKGLLEKYEISNLNLDINQLAWNKLFSQEFIKKLHYNEEATKSTPCPMCKVLTEIEFKKLQENTLRTLNEALQIVKSNQAYLTDRISWAYSVFNDVRTLIYHCYGTYFTTHIPFWNTVGFDITDINNIYELATNEEKNPLIEIFEDIIISHVKDEKFDIVLTDIMFPWDIIPSLSFNIILKKYCPDIHINYAGQGFDEFCFSRVRGKLKKDIRYFFKFDSIFVYRNDMGIIKLIQDYRLGQYLYIENLYYLIDETINTNKLNNNYPFYNEIVPNYDDIKFKDYLIPEPVLIDRLSYRCFWAKCNFCSINSSKTYEHKINVKNRHSCKYPWLIFVV